MAARKLEAGRTGVRGETYAYWYLRRKGMCSLRGTSFHVSAKGEIDLIGYDGRTLAFVEVRDSNGPRRHACRSAGIERHDGQAARSGAGRRGGFLGERHVVDCPCRFDVLAIDNRPGMPPEVRLHKDAFSPQMS